MICKICKKSKLSEILDLGKQPLANKYPALKKDFELEKKFSLKLLFCNNCQLLQIKKIISRKLLFKDYYYLSSVNYNLVKHFKNLAKTLRSSKFVVDIGSNDGILLKPLKKYGVKAIGIDPSINVGKIANDQGLKTIIDFFSENSVKKIIKKYGKPDKIVASSIFTHLKNPLEFAQNIKKLISKDGIFILEIEHLMSFLKKTEFERFYFDRPFYYSLKSIKILFDSVEMSLVDVKKINIHGTSLRCYIQNTKNLNCNLKVRNMLKTEKEFLSIKNLKNFEQKIKKESLNFKKKLINFKKSNKTIIGYGAPARVATITNYCKIDNKLIDVIIDDSPLKQDKFTPGTHIPIVNKLFIKQNKIDIVIVFAYEYFNEIVKNFKKNKIKFYKPIPFRILKR